MKISILLPYKENYSKDIAGAVSLFVNDTSKISKFKKSITIFGSTLSKKFLSKNGTILCDDWNLSQALGVREAIKDFSKEKNINFEIVHERFAQFNLQ